MEGLLLSPLGSGMIRPRCEGIVTNGSRIREMEKSEIDGIGVSSKIKVYY